MAGSWESLLNFFALLLVAAHAVIIVIVSLRVIMKRRTASISLAWLAVIYTLPFGGVIMYFIFGELYLGKKRAQRVMTMLNPFVLRVNQWTQPFRFSADNDASSVKPLRSIVAKHFFMPTVLGNQLTLMTESNRIIDAVILDIESAQASIYFEFYICDEGGRIAEILDALIVASKRGVHCRMLLDSVGSSQFFKSEWPRALRDAGVLITEVLPVGPMRIFFHRQDLRMHRKLVSIDDRIAYTGSMNLIDPQHYNAHVGIGEWIDIMVRMQGPIVPITGEIFEWDWEIETGEQLTHLNAIAPLSIEQFDEDSRVQIIPSGPYFNDDNLQQVLVSALYLARDSIILTTPYFVPDEALYAAIKAASIRGVDVKIILPAKNDSLMVDYAGKCFFEELLACGVEIFQYEGGLLHTKSILIDNSWCLVGTVNLDKRSVWLNFELTLLIDNSPFVLQLYELQQSYIADSKKICLSQWRKRSWLQRFLENLFYLFNPLL